jgi:subtilisin-like proprotein convertase family protein
MERLASLGLRVRSATVAAALLLLAGAVIGTGHIGSGFGAAGSVKVRVPNDVLGSVLASSGGTLVAGYESFSIIETTAAQGQALAKLEGVELLGDENRIILSSGVLDTTRADVKALQQPVGAFEGKRMHLVQFAGPIQPAWLDNLAKTGSQVVTYIPSNTYLIYGDSQQLAAVQALAAADPMIQWNGAFRDEYRVHPIAADAAKDPKRADVRDLRFSVQLFKDPAANAATLALINKLATGPITGEYDVLNYHNLVVAMPPSQLAALAARSDVVSIHAWVEPRMMDERQDMIISGNLSGNVPTGPGYLAWLSSRGFTQAQFTASGFGVDVSDSGIDNGTTAPYHFGLYVNGVLPGASRVIYNRLIGTAHAGSTIQGCDGHGNLNSHIVSGFDNSSGFPFADTSGFHYGLGVCPFVKVGSSVIFDPSTFTSPNYANLQSMAYNDGSRISTNSWGANTGGVYNTDDQSYDALVRDAQPAGSSFPTAGNQEMVIVFAAGNAGSGAGSVGSPGSAKNVITCGAGENVQAFGGPDGSGIDDTGADSANDIISFSSRGPCADGRKKPDLCAPGTHVSGGVAQTATPGATGQANPCFTGSGVSGGPGGSHYWPVTPTQQFYTASSGTSHSTPCIAGACALTRQWFINQGMAAPSPAMTKGFLMNSARYMTGVGAADTLWSTSQGMGELNLGEAFNRVTAAPTLLRDELAADLFTATGQTRTFTGTIADSTKPFRVTVAWTDAPGSTSGAAYNNNIDLTVTVGANTYKGNVFSGASSVTGGVADAADNVESVFLPAGTTGTVQITVTGANINSDGVPGNASPLDQDFALVAYNFTQGNIVVLGGTGANTASDATPNGNGNGRIDPGENHILLTVPVQNTGNIAATSVSGTLVSNTPTATVAVASSAYPNLAAAGGTGSNTTAYVLSVARGHPCGTPINLTLNISSAQGPGTYSFSLPTGLGGSAGPFTVSYTGPVVAIPDNAPAGATATLTVSGLPGTISDLNFRFDGTSCTNAAGATTVGLDHTYVGDLLITLIPPSGPTVTLVNRPTNGAGTASGNNFCQTVLDDSAGVSIETIGATGDPYTGTWQPASPLSALNGLNPNGVWQLHAVDQAAVDTGNIRAFSLIITTATTPQCSNPGCESIDFNCDGSVGTDADIAAFFACIGGSCPPLPCTNTADFNGDGSIGTDADIASFFSRLGGGPC